LFSPSSSHPYLPESGIGAFIVLPESSLGKLLETNSTRVPGDILDRVQESRGQLEAEIRKLLHEVSRVAEQALRRAPR
jgi:hypothetical protein